VAESSKGQRIQELMTFDGRILEMVGDNPVVNVPVDPRIDVTALTADDPDPKFVNVETIRTGVSKTNKRRYNRQVVTEIHQLTAGVQGFLGHPDPSKYGFEFREPQCIYVGSIVQELEGGGSRAVAKAYLFKTSPLREWVPKSIGAKNPMTVSINGTGDVLQNSGVLDVLHISELQSIDWANPGTEGMGTSQAMSVVSEMQHNNEGGNGNMEPKEILKNTTIAELRAYNPDIYNGMVQGVSVQELQLSNPNLYKQIQESGKITEMQLTVDGAQKSVKLSEFQGILDGKDQKIAELQGKIEESRITEYKTKKIAEQVPENMRELFSKRVTGKSEADIDASIAAEIAFVREMGGTINNPPAGNGGNRGTGGDDLKTGVMNLFGAKKEFIK